MSAPTRVRMPNLDDGRPCPCPTRWVCDSGHVHQSHTRAVRCNQRARHKAEAELVREEEKR